MRQHYSCHMEFSVRPVVAEDWQSYRAIRLEMLEDTPTAYVERLSTALEQTDNQWRERTARGSSPTSIRCAAITTDGGWIGSMGGFIPDGHTEPILVGVYVAPRWRGGAAGVTDALLHAVETWARARSESITLEVHEDNARAFAAYSKRGYVVTGNTRPYELDARSNEIEMRKMLR